MASTTPLTQNMRAALVDRRRVPGVTANALVRRGLAVKTTESGQVLKGCGIALTPAGEVERDKILAPLAAGTRVRNLNTQMVGIVVTVERGTHCDVVVLRWDGWQTDTSGSPAFLDEEIDERIIPKINEEAVTELSQDLPVGHQHNDVCGTSGYGFGYLRVSVEMYLSAQMTTKQLRDSLNHVNTCQRAAGRAH